MAVRRALPARLPAASEYSYRREEEELREAHRRAFDEMVERARQQPPEPYDPMRFRAVPPGESCAGLPRPGPPRTPGPAGREAQELPGPRTVDCRAGVGAAPGLGWAGLGWRARGVRVNVAWDRCRVVEGRAGALE